MIKSREISFKGISMSNAQLFENSFAKMSVGQKVKVFFLHRHCIEISVIVARSKCSHSLIVWLLSLCSVKNSTELRMAVRYGDVVLCLVTCEPLLENRCLALGYTHTGFPNKFGSRNHLDAAVIANELLATGNNSQSPSSYTFQLTRFSLILRKIIIGSCFREWQLLQFSGELRVRSSVS